MEFLNWGVMEFQPFDQTLLYTELRPYWNTALALVRCRSSTGAVQVRYWSGACLAFFQSIWCCYDNGLLLVRCFSRTGPVFIQSWSGAGTTLVWRFYNIKIYVLRVINLLLIFLVWRFRQFQMSWYCYCKFVFGVLSNIQLFFIRCQIKSEYEWEYKHYYLYVEYICLF